MWDFSMFGALGQRAIELARQAGCAWGVIRLALLKREKLTVRNGVVTTLAQDESVAFGVRVLHGSAWGFASGFDLTDA